MLHFNDRSMVTYYNKPIGITHTQHAFALLIKPKKHAIQFGIKTQLRAIFATFYIKYRIYHTIIFTVVQKKIYI